MRLGPLGTWEILIILVVVLLLFGARRLPELAKSIGQSVREFRKGVRDMRADIGLESEDEVAPESRPKPRGSAASAGAAQELEAEREKLRAEVEQLRAEREKLQA